MNMSELALGRERVGRALDQAGARLHRTFADMTSPKSTPTPDRLELPTSPSPPTSPPPRPRTWSMAVKRRRPKAPLLPPRIKIKK